MEAKKSIFKKISDDAGFWLLGVFWLFALLNPFFKKYDYGAGYPLVLGFLLILPFLYLFFRKKRRDSLSRVEFWGLLIFGIAYVASFVTSQAAHFGLSEVLAYLSVIPLYYLLANKHIDWMPRFWKLAFWGLIISVAMGTLIYIYLPQMRFYGSFMNIFSNANVWPNGFALFVLMAWPSVIFSFKRKSSWWLPLLLSFVAAGFFLSFSRGAAIAFGGQIALLAIYFCKRFDKQWLLRGTVTVVLAFAIFHGINYARSLNHVTIDFTERVTFAEGTISADERMDFWKASIDFIKEKPLLGWGPFSFRYVYNPVQTTFFGNSDHVHNLFLKIAMENGLLSLVGLLLFLLAWFVAVAKGFLRLKGAERDELVLIIVALAGAVAHSLIDYNFNFFINLLFFFMLLGFARSYVHVEGKIKGSKTWEFGLVTSILLAIFALYETVIFGMIQLGYDDLSRSTLYPRDYYVYEAAEQVEEGDYVRVRQAAKRQVELSPIDSRGYYYMGIAECRLGAWSSCRDNLEAAIKMNPLNDLEFYRAYLEQLLRNKVDPAVVVDLLTVRLQQFRPLVVMNTHFVAYTDQVEAAVELAEMMLPLVSDEEREQLYEIGRQILIMSDYYRKKKTF